MAKIKVLVAFEFDVEPESEEEEHIIEAVTNDCETMRVAFDAQGCWIDDVIYLEA